MSPLHIARLKCSIVAAANIFEIPPSFLLAIGHYCPASFLRVGFTVEVIRRQRL
jgi:hypothetical protein